MTEHANPAASVVDGDQPQQFDPLADEDRDVFELRYDLQQAKAEVERLTKLAEANGKNARYWGDHFNEVEAANRAALGAHHKAGHTVAELITTLAGELDREKRCYSTAFDGRQHAWGELERISKLMGVDEDDFAVEAVAGEVERYIDHVKLVTDRLTRERDEARQRRNEIADERNRCYNELLDLREKLAASRPAVPADAEMRIGTLLSAYEGAPANAVAAEVVGLISSPGWRLSAPVSGSDTTADSAEVPLPMWRSACLDRNPSGSQECHLAKGHEGSHEGGHSMLGLAEWPAVSSGGDTDTTEVPGE